MFIWDLKKKINDYDRHACKLMMVTALILIDSTHLTHQCHSGTLRLNQNDSVLQICKHNQWKIVCSEEWGNLDAAVACRQLGYDGIL